MLELKNTMNTILKNVVDKFNNVLDKTEEKVCELEDRYL